MSTSRWLRNQWDRTTAVVAALIGLVALLLGWIGISGADLATAQLPYVVSGGIFGLFALGVGATLWLSADLRDEWRTLEDIYEIAKEEGRVPFVMEDRELRTRPEPASNDPALMQA